MPSDTTSRTRRVQVRDAQDAFGYQPVAQSVQQAAANAGGGGLASGLAKALGVAGQVATDRVNKNNEYQQRMAELDFASGDVDAENKHRFYTDRIGLLETKRAFADDEQEIRQALAERNPQTREEFDSVVEEFFQRYQGAEQHPQSAQFLIDNMPKLREGLWAEHDANLNKATLDRQSANLGIGLTTEIKDGALPNYEELDASAMAIAVASGQPAGAANDIMADALMQVAEAEGRPDIIDSAPEMVRNITRLRPQLEASRARAEKKRVAKIDAELVEQRIVMSAQHKTLADAGELTPESAFEAVRFGAYSEDQAASLLAKSWSKSIDAASAEANGQLMLQGVGAGIPAKDKQAALEWAAQQHAEVHGISVHESAMRLGLANGEMLQLHKDVITGASASNPESFQRGYQLYQQYAVANEKFARQQIPAAQRSQFDAYRVMTNEMGMDDQTALDKIVNADFEFADSIMRSRNMYELMDTAYASAKDVPWSLSDLKDSPVLMKEVRTQIRTYTAMGFSPEQSADMALENLAKDRVVIDGHAFGYSQGWPTEDTDEYVEWVKRRYIPEGEDPSDYVIVPDYKTRQTNDVLIIRNGDMPFGAGHLKFDIREEATLWQSELRGAAAAEVVDQREKQDAAIRESVVRMYARQGKGAPTEEEIAEALARRKEVPQRVKHVAGLVIQSLKNALPSAPEAQPNRNPLGQR